MGLLSFVPVLGWIAAYGWMLATLDRLRAGRRELPAPGLYLSRGWRLFAVLGLYGLAAVLAAGLLALGGFALANAFAETATAVLGVIIVLFGGSLGLLAVLVVSTLLLAPVAMAVDRAGVRAGLDLRAVFVELRGHRQAGVTAALLVLVAYAIGSLGSAACLLGAALTTGYSLPVVAAALRGYEREARL